MESMPLGNRVGMSEADASTLLNQARQESAPAGPMKLAGVYFLFNGAELVYVGQSGNVLSRIGTHYDERIKTFTAYTVIFQPDKPTRLHWERQLITTFQPFYNVVSLERQGFLRACEVAELFGTTEQTIRDLMADHHIPWAFNGGAWCLTNPAYFEPYLGEILTPKNNSQNNATKLLF